MRLSKALLAIFAVWLSAIPTRATISLDTGSPKCTGTTTTDACAGTSACNLTVTSTTAGHLGTIWVVCDSVCTGKVFTATGDGTWTNWAAATSPSANLVVAGQYRLSLTGGATTITETATGSSGNYNFCFASFSTSLSSFQLDTGATPAKTNTITSAAPTSAALTIAGANDVIPAVVAWGGTLTGVTTYTNFIETNGNGYAIHLNTASGAGAAFTPTTANSGVGGTMAFTEVSSGNKPFEDDSVSSALMTPSGQDYIVTIWGLVYGMMLGFAVQRKRKEVFTCTQESITMFCSLYPLPSDRGLGCHSSRNLIH